MEWHGVCGVDEAGRGPLLGPLVVAAVKVKQEADLDGLGVRDSKKLTPARREEVAAAIRKVAKTRFTIVEARAVDEARSTRSLNEFEEELFAALIEELKPQRAYVDAADVVAEKFGARIKKRLSEPVEMVAEHKADDRYTIVGAASIIAKTVRDERVLEISKELGCDVGSGYPSDPVTRRFLHRWLDEHDELPPHVRHSWEPIRRIVAERAQMGLADYGLS